MTTFEHRIFGRTCSLAKHGSVDPCHCFDRWDRSDLFYRGAVQNGCSVRNVINGSSSIGKGDIMKQRSIRLFFSLLLFLACIVASTDAQVTFAVGGGGGVVSAVGDLHGGTADYYRGSAYGFTSGLNVHAKGKIGLSGMNVTGEIVYASLSNSGNSEPGQGAVEISQTVTMIKVGPEFHFTLPALPISPYVGANVALNTFGGETSFQGVSKVPSATYSIQSARRFGIGFSLGAEVAIGPFVSLDFTTAYHLMNVSGSEWTDINPNVDQRIDSYLALNDVRDPQFAAGDDKHFVMNGRSIHAMMFTVSVLFGL